VEDAPSEDGLAGRVAAVADAVHEQVLAQERRPQVGHQRQHVLLDAREPADRSTDQGSSSGSGYAAPLYAAHHCDAGVLRPAAAVLDGICRRRHARPADDPISTRTARLWVKSAGSMGDGLNRAQARRCQRLPAQQAGLPAR